MLVQGTVKFLAIRKTCVGNKLICGGMTVNSLKINAAGVMPIIFAQAIMFITITIVGFSKSESMRGCCAFMNNPGFWLLCFAVRLFCLPISIRLSPSIHTMAEEMKR
jgi:preprotein translocase subunit SecY